MATGGVSLTDLVTCQICFYEFEGRDPRVLPCQHAFCSPCLTNVFATAQRTADTSHINCPMCKHLTVIPQGKISNLPKFFMGAQIQDIIKQQEVKESRCTFCRRNPKQAVISFYCFGCVSPLCLECKGKHDRNPRNLSHDSCPITQSTVKYLTCQIHERHVEAFCINCNAAVCSVCMVDGHDAHSIHDFTLEEEGSVQHLEQLLTRLEHEVVSHASRLAKMKRCVNVDLDAVQREVDGHHTNVLKKIRQQHTDLCQQIQQHRKQANVEIEKSQKLVNEAEAIITKLCNQSKSWRQPLPEVTAVHLADVGRLDDEIKHQIPSLAEVCQEPKSLRFQPGAILSLGELSDAVKESLHAISVPTHDRGQDRHVPPSLMKELRVTKNKSFSTAQLVWKISGQSEACGIDFLRDGSVIVVCRDGIRVLDRETGRSVKHGLSDMCREPICDVAASRTADIVAAVTWNQPGRLQIMTTDGGQWRNKRHKVNGDPSRVTLTTDNSVLVGYFGGNILTKYNMQGVKFGQIALSSAPRYICTDNTNRIIASHKDHVTVYDGSREILSIPAATEWRKLDSAGVCTDSDDNIYICDEESSAVLKYDRRGQFANAIQLEKMPWRLAIYQDRLLAVVSGCEPYDVLLYKL